jgi:tRNA dimethylallyltransferase
VIDEIREKGKIPLVVCGTGLYLAALTEGFFPLPEMSEKKKAAICEKIKSIEEKGSLYEYLMQIDGESAESIHPNDAYRIRRAIEIYLLTNKGPSYHRKQAHKKGKKNYVFTGLTMERELLYMRIDQRVEEMVRSGFIEEVNQLLKLGYDKELGAFHAPGYSEFIKYLSGSLSRESAIEETKTKTRNYAKRQFAWFKKIDEAEWFDVTEGPKTKIDEFISLFQKEI